MSATEATVRTPRKPVIGSVMLAALAATAVIYVVRMDRGELAHYRAVFAGLVGGRASVQRDIAWERLEAMGVHVGETYTHLPDDRQRAQYRQAFIRSVAAAFRQQGGAARSFTRWRIAERTAERVVVAADYPAKEKVLLLEFAASGPKQLKAIRWQ